jgi:hypothetical protein
MATIFPLSASVGQEFQGYMYDGTIWNLVGNEYNPTTFSSNPPDNPKPGDLWVDSVSEVDILNDTNLVNSSDLNSYLTIQSASSTYATKAELENIDLSSASAEAVAAIVDSAPSTLNTLNELAAALNDDANFSATVTASLGNKLDASSASTTYLSKNEASSTYLTSASMQTVPVYVMNSGSSAQRPVSPSAGMFRFNTTAGYPEWYDPNTSSWWNFYQQKNILVEYLVIAGGGGGGGGSPSSGGGGGGAGGYLTGSESLSAGTSYTITIGSGGVGRVGSSSWSNGDNSTFGTITATGGGKGGTDISPYSGASGGSGGGGGGGTGSGLQPNTGGARTASLLQGNNGGNGGHISGTSLGGGGGGGAGSAGGDYSVANGGNGGSGLSSSITGVSVTRAGGGGGSINTNTGARTPGAAGSGGGGIGGYTSVPGTGSPNTGGGGGGGAHPTEQAGANGGSGVVIIAYPNTYNNLTSIGAGLIYTLDTTSRAGYRVYTFTGGTGEIAI